MENASDTKTILRYYPDTPKTSHSLHIKISQKLSRDNVVLEAPELDTVPSPCQPSQEQRVADIQSQPADEIPPPEVPPLSQNGNGNTPNTSSITENPIVNLSSVELSHSDLCLLRKGLSFCPDTNHINEYQLHLDLHNFARNLRLREHFHESVSSHPTHPFRQSSSFTPFASKDVNLDVYVRAVQKDVLVQCKRKNSNAKASNLQPDEKKSLEDLQQRDDIVIKPADKGGAIVIMDTTMYKVVLLRMLSKM